MSDVIFPTSDIVSPTSDAGMGRGTETGTKAYRHKKPRGKAGAIPGKMKQEHTRTVKIRTYIAPH
ncbi:MAG TPA: hypothetical protein DIW30_05360 [Bacteroidales bacterium]|nr:hypothetical protein [Bacteroidales bacterium]